ncbi:MAG: energy transducer TonB [Deltaproteobacteria bacterium]|nr:energy transducer TonB [Deltaproteobacteria bacterium]
MASLPVEPAKLAYAPPPKKVRPRAQSRPKPMSPVARPEPIATTAPASPPPPPASVEPAATVPAPDPALPVPEATSAHGTLALPSADEESSSREPGKLGSGAPGPFVPSRPLAASQRPPGYPESARRWGREGTARVKVRVMEDGTVGHAFLLASAGHPDLDQAALDAVSHWRFTPARRGDMPVASWVVVPIEFRLR